LIGCYCCKTLRPCFRLQWCLPNYAKFWGLVLDCNDVFQTMQNSEAMFLIEGTSSMYAIMCGSLKRSRDQWNLSNWCSVNFQEYLLHHINGWITIGHTNDSRFNPWCEIFSLNFSFFFDYQPVLILFGNALILKHLIIAMIMFWYCIMSVDALNSIVKKFNNSSRFFQQSSKSDSTKKSAHLKQISYTIYNPSKQSQNP
jgi:hypothetical protein